MQVSPSSSFVRTLHSKELDMEDCFCKVQIEKMRKTNLISFDAFLLINFFLKKLPVADSQVYERIFNAILQKKKLLKKYLWRIAKSMSAFLMLFSKKNLEKYLCLIAKSMTVKSLSLSLYLYYKYILYIYIYMQLTKMNFCLLPVA